MSTGPSPAEREHDGDERPAADPSLVGQTIAGKFEVLEILGSGAMGRVYKARQADLDRLVAIKVLHGHLGGDARVGRRFHREAKAASRLSHPNSLQILDFGSSSGLLYIVMELLDGEELQVVIDHDSPLAPARIASVLVPVLRAVDEAHRAGIVHRDLKPENVIVWTDRSGREHVKVCDFGIAKIIDGEGSSITVDGFVCGTPQYMAPEQARGDTIDHRLDVYAAGVVLYQMLCGSVPFTGETALGIITRHLTDDPVPPSERKPEWNVPASLEEIALRAMQKAPADRFQTAGAMADAIEEAVRALGPDASLKLDDPGLRKHAARAQRSPSRADATARTRERRDAAGRASAAATGEAAHAPTDSQIRPATLPQRPLWPWLVALALAVAAAALVASMLGGEEGAAPAEGDGPPAGPHAATADPGGGGGGAEAPTIAEEGPPAGGTSGTTPGTGVEGTEAPGAGSGATSPTGSAGARPGAGAGAGGAGTRAGAGAAGATAGGTGSALGPNGTGAGGTSAGGAEPAAGGSGGGALSPYDAAFAEGRRRFLANDVSGAIASFEEAARLSPSSAEVQKQLGRAYMRAGDTARSVGAYRRYLELAPDAPDRAIVEGIIASHAP